ncbi:hypothetical protein KFU94_35320 [Chloroflexi bacterium TSY]|nr:hypothetical protein [Chloroflexi bacterium TSY]
MYDETIWAGTDTGFVVSRHPQTGVWSQILTLESEIYALLVADHTLWIGTERGLYQLSLASASGMFSDGSQRKLQAERVHMNGQQDFPVFSLFAWDKTIWVGSYSGLWRYEKDQWSRIPIPGRAAYTSGESLRCLDSTIGEIDSPVTASSTPNPSSLDFNESIVIEVDSEQFGNRSEIEIHALWIDPEEALWIGGPYGVARSVPGTRCWTVFPTIKPNGEPARVQKLFGNNDHLENGGHSGSVWAVTDGGGARQFDDWGQVTLEYGRTVAGNLSTDFVRDVAVDRDGTVWFATPIGVFRYMAQTWLNEPDDDTSTFADGNPNFHDIRDLLVGHDGAIWIATGAGVRYKRDIHSDESHFTASNSALPHDAILSLAQDNEGAIWAGTYGQGLSQYQNELWTNPVQSSALPSPIVIDLLVHGETLWVGTEEGLAAVQLSDLSVKIESSLLQHAIESLALDSTGSLWIGTSTADIWVRSPDGSWQVHGRELFDSLASFANLPVHLELSLAPDPQTPGGMWLAIDRVGLFHWDGTTWTDGDPEQNLPTTFLWTLFTDGQSGDLWIGNEAGVTRFDGTTWGTFKASDGLRSPAIYAIAKTAEGGYWFGGRQGLSYYQPDRTSPWLLLDSVVGATEPNEPFVNGQVSETNLTVSDSANREASGIEAVVGTPVSIRLRYGDLQTPQQRLKLLYRQRSDSQSSAWTEFTPPFEPQFDATGLYVLDFRVRDQAFNYSVMSSLPVSVIARTPTIRIPGQGEAPLATVLTLIALSIVAVAGFGYVCIGFVRGRRHAVDAMKRGYNPYVSGEPIRGEEMFFARYDLLQRIVDTLHNNSIMIHGERRIGKTTLLYQLASKLEDVADPDYWFLPIYIDLEGTTQEKFFHFLMEEIAQRVFALFGDVDNSLESDQLRYLNEYLEVDQYAFTTVPEGWFRIRFTLLIHRQKSI